MKHFKLFLLPLLAMTLVFSSCEQQDLSLTYIEPIQDWGKSPQDILEKMTKSKSGATLEYSESDDGYCVMYFKNYGISDYLLYNFVNNRLIFCQNVIYANTYKQTIKDHFDKHFTLIQVKKDEESEDYLYHNKKKTSSIILNISDAIQTFYLPYNDGDIEDFYETLDETLDY